MKTIWLLMLLIIPIATASTFIQTDGGTCASNGCFFGVNGFSEFCQEVWDCTDWSMCSGGTQTRTCVDLNDCGSTYDKPVLVISCSTPPSDGGGGGNDQGDDNDNQGKQKDCTEGEIVNQCVCENAVREKGYCIEDKYYAEAEQAEGNLFQDSWQSFVLIVIGLIALIAVFLFLGGKGRR